MDSLNTTIARESYEPPTIEDIPVRAEEQLLAGCKQGAHAGPGIQPFGCNIGFPNPCTRPSQS